MKRYKPSKRNIKNTKRGVRIPKAFRRRKSK